MDRPPETKYRNKIGLDVAIEAVRDVLRKRKATVDEVMKFAWICRVFNVMRPYLEATVDGNAKMYQKRE